MKDTDVHLMTLDQLVQCFVSIANEQVEAELYENLSRLRKLFWRMEAVENELKSRPGDQRRLLISLYDHPSAQVRLKAATATLALEPKAARLVLARIHERNEFPQALEAGMRLWNLDRGVFKPT